MGSPAGKIKRNETRIQAAMRELAEETRIETAAESLVFVGTTYHRYPDLEFTYYKYRLELVSRPDIFLDRNAHTEYLWAHPRDALRMNLIEDETRSIALCCGFQRT